jgi:uncharacterized protein DUF4242
MFIVDRVIPGLTADLLAEAQRCLQEAVRRVSDGGEAVRYLRCTFIPDQQRCLDLFEAVSADEVRRVNDIAQVPFRWIGQASEDAEPGMAVGTHG